ncbi:MAG: Fic family protein [Vulcanimicrobiaceae bacterium]
MAHYETRYWPPIDVSIGLPDRERQGGQYQVYMPDLLTDREFLFRSREAADVADAELAIARLNESAKALANTEAITRLLLRAESVASSKIEGLEVGARRLLRADAVQQFGQRSKDVTANEVLANIEAMRFALRAVPPGGTISVSTLLETHRLLLGPTPLAAHGGRIRNIQNWIGGSDYNPCAAAFVPPPPESVHALLSDLVHFCNGESLPAVAQAAIAHAQFETIHPFVDGNGRVGRALIHMVLRRRGLATAVSPPVSLVLATRSKDYVNGLTAMRYAGTPDSFSALDGINGWIGTFAGACHRAVLDAETFEQRIAIIQSEWNQRLGAIRANSSVALLVGKLPGAPVITVEGAANLIGRSTQATNEAIERLVEAGVLVPIRLDARRNRVFETREVIVAFTALERQLASSVGDTRIEPPNRPVPYRVKGF